MEVKKEGFTVSGEDVTVESEGRAIFTASISPVADATPAATFKNSLGMEFVLVPKGKSWLGGGGGKLGDKEVEIAHDFYLGKYEVTQEEWEKVTGRNPSHFSRGGGGKDAVKDIADAELKRFPVEHVFVGRRADVPRAAERAGERKRDGCIACRRRRNGSMPAGGAAGRQVSTARFDFYFDKPTNQLLPEQANFRQDGKGLKRTCKVGTYKPNRLGLYDMHGNVWEWVPMGVPAEPKDAKAASRRVVRGGS